MTFKIIIPARLGSTRLPNKPLKDIGGKTLLQRVVEQAKKSNADSIYVATDSEEIVKHCAKINVESVLTSSRLTIIILLATGGPSLWKQIF